MGRHQALDSFDSHPDWQRINFPTSTFTITGMLRQARKATAPLTVYIEGDGLAWLSQYEKSSDPTPRDPLAMKMAAKHPKGPVLYLARPCQFVTRQTDRNCHAVYWTSHRYAPEVVTSMSEAIDTALRRTGAQKLVLIGYSGGGAVAALLAASRRDVIRLITIAGNLDHHAWTKAEKLTPLYGSMNPADHTDRLLNVDQTHFVGGKDKVVPPLSVFTYRDRFPPRRRPIVKVMENFDHDCCWLEAWPRLLRYTGS